MAAVSTVVFLAIAAYFGFSVLYRTTDPVQTALVVEATMTDASGMSGLVVRDEVVVKGSAEFIDVTAEDGEKIASGEAVAVIYSSAESLERAVRLESMRQDIESMKAAMTNVGSIQASENREKSIYNALIGLSGSIRSDGLTSADAYQSTLGSLLFRTEITNETDIYLDELQAEYNALLVTVSGETDRITVTDSGTFSSVVDGYEGVSPEFVRDLTPDQLREVIAAERVIEPDTLGKIITSFNWYYAAIVDKEDAARLEKGKTVWLSFGRYYSEYLKATVDYLGKTEGGEQLVVFSVNRGMTDMVPVRAVSAELIYSEFKGLRVPLKSLYRYYAGYMSDEDARSLSQGDAVQLTLGYETYNATVSEIGSAQRYGELPAGVESGGEFDTRPTRRLVVFCWHWSADEDAPNFSSGGGTVMRASGYGRAMTVTNYYDYDEDVDRLCVFTMTGLQAERKRVDLIFAGEEYCLLSSEGTDALREGNEVIVETKTLYNGKVFR